MAKRRSPG